jgi:hypothetical protein
VARQQHRRHQQKTSKPMAKTNEEAKTEKDKRNEKVMTEMETSSRTQRSLSSSNLPP